MYQFYTYVAIAPLFDPIPLDGNCGFDDTVCRWTEGGLTGGFSFPGTYWPMKEPSSANWPWEIEKKRFL